MKLFIGIDPGLTGAVAVIDHRRRIQMLRDTPTVCVKKAKGKRNVYVEAEMAKLLVAHYGVLPQPQVAIENVHAMPKQGVSTMFNMGIGFGLWLGIIAAFQLPVTKIQPRAWKKKMGLAVGADKQASIVRARQLFPTADIHLKKHDGRAEALLIAEYLRRMERQA